MPKTTDPIVITHQGRQRSIDVQQMCIRTPTGGDITMHIEARTNPEGGQGIEATTQRLRAAEFTQTEVVQAFKAANDELGLGLTLAQIRDLVLGAPEHAIRARYEDE